MTTALPATAAATVIRKVRQGKVPGGDHGGDSPGDPRLDAAFAGYRLGDRPPIEADHVGRVEAAEVDGLADVAVRLGPGFRRPPILPGNSLEAPFLHRSSASPKEHPRPLRDRP